MLFIFCANRIYVNAAALIKFLRFQCGVYSRTAFIRRFQSPAQRFEICHLLAFLLSLCFTATVKRIPEEVIITPFIRDISREILLLWSSQVVLYLSYSLLEVTKIICFKGSPSFMINSLTLVIGHPMAVQRFETQLP